MTSIRVFNNLHPFRVSMFALGDLYTFLDTSVEHSSFLKTSYTGGAGVGSAG